MVLVLTAIIGTGFYTLAILRDWRFLVNTQLRLNQCVAKSAIILRDRLTAIETSNLAINGLRASILAAQIALQPHLIPPLQVTLMATVALQEGVLAEWKARSIAWLALQGCGKLGDLALPLPQLKYERRMRDTIGEQPLTWQGTMPEEFRVQVFHLPRKAAGRIRRRDGWKADWTKAQLTKRAGVD